MAIKGYSAFPNAPALVEPHNQMFSNYFQDTHWRSLTPLQRCSRCIFFSASSDWAKQKGKFLDSFFFLGYSCYVKYQQPHPWFEHRLLCPFSYDSDPYNTNTSLSVCLSVCLSLSLSLYIYILQYLKQLTTILHYLKTQSESNASIPSILDNPKQTPCISKWSSQTKFQEYYWQQKPLKGPEFFLPFCNFVTKMQRFLIFLEFMIAWSTPSEMKTLAQPILMSTSTWTTDSFQGRLW